MISCQEVGVRRFLSLSWWWLGMLLASWSVAALAGPEPRVMSDEVMAALAKGFQQLSQSKFSEAQAEFEKIIRVDFDNPFANNNLAVLMEKQGRLLDAMAYLKIGAQAADQYLHKVETLYLIGGVCAAVNPEPAIEEKSPVAQIIAGNKKKLEEKLGSKAAEPPAGAGK